MVRENGMVMISEEEYRRLNKDAEENEILGNLTQIWN